MGGKEAQKYSSWSVKMDEMPQQKQKQNLLGIPQHQETTGHGHQERRRATSVHTGLV
jgi:hypothetical protein